MPEAVPPPDAAALGVQGKSFAIKPDGVALAEIARLVDAGKVKTRVGSVLPLSQARRAHELAQAGHTHGKVVLQVSAD